jgi:hypothetical protein
VDFLATIIAAFTARELYTDANSIFEFGWSPRQAAETPARRIARLLREDPSQITDDMLGALTPNDNMELARLYDEGATGMPMPMDEASRMSRAGEHWPGEAYHSTRADFPAFDRGDVGFHVGTDEQAWQRMVQTRRENGMEGEAILPLRVRASNGLTTPDAGEWNDARFAADAMQRGGLHRPATYSRTCRTTAGHRTPSTASAPASPALTPACVTGPHSQSNFRPHQHPLPQA